MYSILAILLYLHLLINLLIFYFPILNSLFNLTLKSKRGFWFRVRVHLLIFLRNFWPISFLFNLVSSCLNYRFIIAYIDEFFIFLGCFLEVLYEVFSWFFFFIIFFIFLYRHVDAVQEYAFFCGEFSWPEENVFIKDSKETMGESWVPDEAVNPIIIMKRFMNI